MTNLFGQIMKNYNKIFNRENIKNNNINPGGNKMKNKKLIKYKK